MRNRRGGLAWFAQATLVLFLVSFGAISTARAREALKEKIEQSYPVPLDGQISITNIDGSIRIYGSTLPEVNVQAIKKAYTQERLQELAVVVQQTAGGVEITTNFPPRRGFWGFSDQSGTVDYVLVVPQKIDLTKVSLINGEILLEGVRGRAQAKLVNGRITAHNSLADLDLTVSNGGIDAFFDWWEKKAFQLSCFTQNGNIFALLPAEASLKADAETLNGNIANGFKLPKPPSDAAGAKWSTTIGTESNPEVTFHLRSTNGSIKLEKAKTD